MIHEKILTKESLERICSYCAKWRQRWSRQVKTLRVSTTHLLKKGATGALVFTLPWTCFAGSGQVNSDGTIDITVNLRFPPTAADLTTVQNQVTAASQVLWDASEGQLRFGDVTITCGSVDEDLADMWIFPQAGRAGVSFSTDGSALGRVGAHINQFLPSSTGIVMAHEFGHFALGLGDEYSEQSRFGNCWGYGPCIETANLTERNQCLMQQPGGFTQSEFCTMAGHDAVLGDGLSCAAMPVPHGCTNNCMFYNHTTDLYETTQQTALSGVDCWTHIANNFSFLTTPAGLPVAALPAGFTNPNFINNCLATDTVMLILDRSGSMLWNTESDNGEVCGDGIDNDGDGTVDETDDCTQTRLSFVQAAARAWLGLAIGQGVRAGVVSFNQTATLDEPFQEVNAANQPSLNAAVDALMAGGNTGIGTALTQTIFTFDAETTALNKTAFLITDGVNTDGPEPETVVDDLRDRGIRVFTISTGGASDDDTLAEISGATSGSLLDSPDASAMVNAFVRQWADYRNIGTLIPILPYAVNAKSKVEDQLVFPTSEEWCAAFDFLDPTTLPNPWEHQGLQFTFFDFAGARAKAGRISQFGEYVGIDTDFTTEVQLYEPCSEISISLVHFSQPSLVIAFDANKRVLDRQMMTAKQATPETLTLSGQGEAIHSIRVEAPQNETLILELCGLCTTTVGRSAELWSLGLEDVLAQMPPEHLPLNNLIQFQIEPEAEKITLVAAGNMSEMAGFGVQAKLIGPAGPNPSTFDSETPDPLVRVVRDRYFLLVEILKPNPGTWSIDLRSAAGAATIQTGNLTLIGEVARTDLFTDLDRQVILDENEPVKLSITPIHGTSLRDLELLQALVKRPDGTFQSLAINQAEATGGQGDYTAQIADMPQSGLYEVRVFARSGPATYNDPGEAIWEPAPPTSLPVPEFERAATEYFFVLRGSDQADCPPLNIHLKGDIIHLAWTVAQPAEIIVQAAPTVNGPWTNLGPGTTTDGIHYRTAVPVSKGMRFFQLWCRKIVTEQCVDLRSLDPTTVENPWPYKGFEFFFYDFAGAPANAGRIVEFGEFIGLDTNFRTDAIFDEPCSEVSITLVHFSQPGLVTAFDANGQVLDQQKMIGPQGTEEKLTLSGQGERIRSIRVDAPQNEILILELCCQP